MGIETNVFLKGKGNFKDSGMSVHISNSEELTLKSAASYTKIMLCLSSFNYPSTTGKYFL